MLMSFDALQFLILAAMAVTCLSPIILIVLLVRDWLEDQLW